MNYNILEKIKEAAKKFPIFKEDKKLWKMLLKGKEISKQFMFH